MNALDESARKVFVLERELDISNADHIALYLDANKPLDSNVSWLACRIIEAHESRVLPLLNALDASAEDVAEMTNWPDEQIRGWAYAVARIAQSTVAKARGEA